MCSGCFVEAEANSGHAEASSQGPLRSPRNPMVSPPKDEFNGGGALISTYPGRGAHARSRCWHEAFWSRNQEGEALACEDSAIVGGP